MTRLNLRQAVVALVGILTISPDVNAQDQAAYLGANIAIHTGSAIVWDLVNGDGVNPIRAILGGTVGGTISYAGMRLVGTQEEALRFAGLQTAAVGSSITRNASAGKPILSELIFPVYPMYVRVRPWDEDPIRIQLSLASALTTLTMAFRYDAHFDVKETLITGAPVFAADREIVKCSSNPTPYAKDCRGTSIWARHEFGGIVYADSDFLPESTLTHESGHIAQFTRDAILHALPMSDAVLERVGLGNLANWLAVDFFLPLRAANYYLAPEVMRIPFYEWETDAMMGIDVCERGYPGC